MSDLTVDPRMLDWLADGPTRAPSGSFDAIMAGVAAAPQERAGLRLAGRPIRVTTPQLALAAALVVAVAGVGVVLVRQPLLDAIAGPRAPDDLLYAFPETRTVLEATGGPSESADRTTVGTLPNEAALVIAVDCVGRGEVTVQVVDPSVLGPAEGESGGEEPTPYAELPVRCGAGVATLRYATFDAPGGQALEVRVVADPGTTWRAAVGQVRSVPGKPAFDAVQPGEGELLLSEGLTSPVAGAGWTPGVAFDPAGAASVTLVAQCLGDPITVVRDGAEDDIAGVPVARLSCAEAGEPQAVEIAVDGPGWARATSDGFTWVRLSAVATPADAPTRPQAPPLPGGLGDVLFAEGDRENVAFGSLGGNRQTIVRLDASVVGKAGGGFVAIAHPIDSGATALELWSIANAAPVATLAIIDGAEVFDSWVDATHEQVFYGTVTPLGVGEWRRVALDGSGDTLVGRTPMGLREAIGMLAVDDAQFVAQWCPLIGSCERAIYDTTTGDVRTVTRADDGICNLVGVVGGQLIAQSPGCDAPAGEQRITAEDLDDGSITTLVEGPAGAAVFPGPEGPQVLVFHPGDTQSVVEVVGIDGTGRREVARIDHESGLNPYVSPLRLPAGDWILLAGPLADTPTQHMLTPIPVLLNVVTGEQIALPNLPGGE
jgi:hypothetical protein